MSHFSVLVVTKDEPADDVLSAALQPFHEFECTGTDDQYVVDVDKTEEVLVEFKTGTVTRLRAPDGTLHEPYADEFYRDPTPEESAKIGPIAGSGCGGGFQWSSKDWGDGLGYRTKIKFTPDGYVDVKVPRCEVETIAEYCEGYHGWRPIRADSTPDTENGQKYGYAVIDNEGNLVKAIDRTNPRAKWDWWQVGGRYSGLLMPRNKSEAMKGRPGLMGSQCDEKGADVARKSNVDWEAMAHRDQVQRLSAIETVLAKIGAATGKSRDELLEIHRAACATWPELRAAYDANTKVAFFDFINNLHSSHPVRIARDLKLWHSFDGIVGDYGVGCPETEPDPIEWAKKPEPFTCFAMVKDGQWLERGEMGWWACVSNEKDKDMFEQEFTAALDSVPDDHWLTVVDCHI